MDLKTALHSVIYAAKYIECEELMELRTVFGKVLGKEFVSQSDSDPLCLHKTVSKRFDNHFYLIETMKDLSLEMGSGIS